nr:MULTISPECIES: glycosyltransferase [unclassified Leucobacter]
MIPSWYPEKADGFSGSFFREQAEAFISEGHAVGVLVVRGIPIYQYGDYKQRAQRGTYQSEGDVNVFRADALMPVPKLHPINLASLEKRWLQLFKTYVSRFGRPDVLNAHAMFPAGIVASRISRKTGIPFVITEHRPSSIDLLRSPGYRGPALRAAKEAKGLVAVAKGFAPELNEAYRTDKWEYLPGLLSPQFEDLPVRTPPTGPFVFGHVSHLDPGKRVDLLIDAFGDAFGSDNTVRLRIAGDSAHRVGLEKLVKERGLSNVDFVGAVSREHIAKEFSRYHSFVLTSEKEAFGTVLWEAMACGLPIVSTDTWAGKNAVSRITGLMTPIDDRKALAATLQEMQTKFSEFDPLAIRYFCVDHCGRKSFVNHYMGLYNRGTI